LQAKLMPAGPLRNRCSQLSKPIRARFPRARR
jgi:hypothetical protein